MKNSISFVAKGLISKSLDSDYLIPVDKAIDAARAEAAQKAWAARHAAGEGGTQLHGAIDEDIGLANAVGHAQVARDVLQGAKDAKGRHEIAGRLMEAQQHIKNAQVHAGHYGSLRRAKALQSLHTLIGQHIGQVFSDKMDTPDAEKLEGLRSRIDSEQKEMHILRGSKSKNFEEGGGGVLPHTKALARGDSSREHTYHGGVELHGKREAVRQRMKSLGFGRVDQAVKGDGQDNDEHELWEHPDGRTVRVSHTHNNLDEHTLTVKERSHENLDRSRREFVTSYGGNKGVNEQGRKAGIPPKDVKVGMESELPLFPDAPPKRRAK